MPFVLPQPCHDCVEVHGDSPSAWLSRWPEGAEYRRDWRLYLCDGCVDARLEHGDPFADSDPYADRL